MATITLIPLGLLLLALGVLMGPNGFVILATLVAGLLGPGKKTRSHVILDGSRTEVYWNDGDSFRITGGLHAGTKVRLQGYNTLESYGPVHSWGDWKANELSWKAKEATDFARNGVWHCKSSGSKDKYGRLLVQCTDLVEAMVANGHGHLFLFDEPPPGKSLEMQRKAIEEKKGMWAKGAPDKIITSVHSATEPGLKTGYNRVVDLKTGKNTKVEHNETYDICEKVCQFGSCMVYVPFEQRYGRGRAKCLRYGK